MKWTTISVLSIVMAGVAVAGQAASLREQVERLIPEQVVAAVRAQADGARDGDAAIEVWGVGLAARRAALLEQFDEATACAWLSEARHRLLAPELFNVARIAVIRRTHGNLAQPANWAAVRELNLKGLTNEIAVLTGLRGEPSVRPLYQPPPETFAGEMCLHWDAQQVLPNEPACLQRQIAACLSRTGGHALPFMPLRPHPSRFPASLPIDLEPLLLPFPACRKT